MDRSDYDEKMQKLFDDNDTYEKVSKSPFKRIEREFKPAATEVKTWRETRRAHTQKITSTDATLPAIWGSVKHHKPDNPLRPIITCRDTALYNSSRYLSDILSPLQNNNGFSVNNSTEFTEKLHGTKIDEDEIIVSFDVISLFTAIPVDRACEFIRNKLNNDITLKNRTKLSKSIDDIIKLLRFTLSNSYFNYNNQTYKQIYGCTMGSPVTSAWRKLRS